MTGSEPAPLDPRIRWGVWAALAIAIVVAAVVAPGPVGIYHDDGIYIGAAMSLANGDGYRIPHLPAAPWQAKYPPLFPWLLTPIAACTGGPGTTGLSAGTLAWFRLPVVLSLLGALAMLPRLFRRWGMDARTAVWATALTGVSPLVFQHGFHVMSEAPFLCASVGLLVLLPEPEVPMSPGRWVGCTACAVAAIWCRSVGIALLPALAWVAWRRRREWIAWTPLAAALIAFGGWTVVAGAARGGEAGRELGPLYRYYLGYGAWITFDVGALLGVATENALGVWTGFGTALCGARINDWPAWRWIAGAVGTLVVVGWRWWPRAERPALAYLAASLALFLIWPFPVDRFLIPLTPFAVWGAWQAVQVIAARFHWPSAVATALGAVALGSCALTDLVHFPTARGLPLLATAQPAGVYRAAAAWVRDHTAPEDIIVTNDDPWLWLATGRRTLPPGDLDPLWIYRPPSLAPADWDRVWRSRFEQFEAEARRLGARWILAGPDWDPFFFAAWQPGVAGAPDRFQVVHAEGTRPGERWLLVELRP